MVHRSYLSPDGRHVLAVVMSNQGKFLPCRVVSFDGSSPERIVGPPDATCTSGAWSPDGKWVYLSSDKGGKFHIWRQRFPDGQPEQVTSGPTEEEGIAMVPDGKSLLTSVGILTSTVWVHDAQGDHQLTSEGNASATWFSSDGRKLYYLMQSGEIPDLELWTTDLATRKSERLLPGYSVEVSGITNAANYTISQDGKQIAFAEKDKNDISHLWLAATDRRSSPRQVPSTVNEDSPFFLPDGDLIFRSIESGQNFLYRMKPDGSSRRKIDPDPIFDLFAASPDGRWAAVQTKGPDNEHPYSVVAYPVEGGQSVRLCNALCWGFWDTHGKFSYLMFDEDQSTYVLPVSTSRGLPDLPAEGVVGGADLRTIDKVAVVPNHIDSATGPDSTSYTQWKWAAGEGRDVLDKKNRRYALNVLDADGKSTRIAIHLQPAPTR